MNEFIYFLMYVSILYLMFSYLPNKDIKIIKYWGLGLKERLIRDKGYYAYLHEDKNEAGVIYLLQNSFKEALLLGEPLLIVIEDLLKILERSKKIDNKKKDLVVGAMTRFSFLVLAALIGRLLIVYLLKIEFLDKNEYFLDQAFLCISLFLSIVIFYGYIKQLPESWFLEKEILGCRNWLDVNLKSKNVFAGSLGNDWNYFMKQELLLGVSMRDSKRNLLKSWVFDNFRKEKLKLKRMEELTSVMEILAGSCVSALILFVPAWKII